MQASERLFKFLKDQIEKESTGTVITVDELRKAVNGLPKSDQRALGNLFQAHETSGDN